MSNWKGFWPEFWDNLTGKAVRDFERRQAESEAEFRRASEKKSAAATPSEGIDAQPNFEGLSRAQIMLAITEITEADPKVCQDADALLSGSVSADASFYADFMEDSPGLAALGHAFSENKRLAVLDWAECSDECIEHFGEIFRSSGLNWPDDIEAGVNELRDGLEIDRGDDIGLVYYMLRGPAEQQGYEILSLNSGGDMYEFFLAPLAVSDRWRSVQLGDGLWIENPDWQFAQLFKRAGWELKYPDHPNKAPKPAPHAD